MYDRNVIQKFSIRSFMLLSLILIVSVSMVSSPILSSIMYSFSNSPTQSFIRLAYAQNGDDSGESDNSDFSSLSSPPTDSTSSTTTDPSLASSSTTTDPSLASSSTTTDQSTIQNPIPLTDTGENSSSSSSDNNGKLNLDCDGITDRNFIVSSNDPNGFDEDSDGIACESNGDNSNRNLTTSPQEDIEGPDGDCLFDPNLPKCASIDGECPDGFFQNGYEQCVPAGGCPDGYHTVDDDETGRCFIM